MLAIVSVGEEVILSSEFKGVPALGYSTPSLKATTSPIKKVLYWSLIFSSISLWPISLESPYCPNTFPIFCI